MHLEQAIARQPTAIIAARKLRGRVTATQATALLFTPTVPLAHAYIKQRHGGRDYAAADWSGPIHPSAVIHETAVIDPTAVVEPNAVINERIDQLRLLRSTLSQFQRTDQELYHPQN